MRLPNWYLLFLGVCLTGCGARSEPLGVVTGRVVHQGKPVSGGTVIFQSADGRTSIRAPLADDGTFRMETFDQKGLPPGKYRVAVKPASSAGGAVPLAGEGKEAGAAQAHPLIPARFHDPETSKLTAEVRTGDNPPLEFDLGRQ